MAFVVMIATVVVPAPAAVAMAGDDAAVIEFTGHGWGHGRGLGQYGARGYADRGWSSAQILDHYYGGTSAGQAPAGGPVDAANVRVDLRFMRGRTTAVALGQGAIALRGTDDADLGRVTTGAARLRKVDGGFELQTAATCTGPWTAAGSISGRSTVRLIAETTAAGAQGLLQVCGPNYRTWYRGEVHATVAGNFALTVNVVDIDTYLEGVVPNEMPASWAEAALQAQAVAARSYAMAGDSRQLPYADTCDTTRCQVYDGVYTQRGGVFRTSTHPRTDAAIAATTGVVRLRSNGTVARTEFSSSTGGYTAGGDFPAVIDEGDSIAANPNHDWQTTVPVAKIEDRYNRGALQAIEVIERNGLGEDGGRAERVELRFERGTVTVTGNALRSFLGLKSDWFTPGAVQGVDPRSTPEGAYIDRTYQVLAGRSATDEEIGRWFDAVVRGDRRSLTDSLVVGDYFIGELLDDLYEAALGREPDAGGRQYWIEQVRAGLKLDAVGVLFYGSQEYYDRAGGTDAAFVTALYRDILGRAPDAAGKRYWEERMAEGSANFDDVAAGFYSSLESRRARVTRLHVRLLGPIASPEVRDALAGRLLAVDDVALAAEIAASREAFDG